MIQLRNDILGVTRHILKVKLILARVAIFQAALLLLLLQKIINFQGQSLVGLDVNRSHIR